MDEGAWVHAANAYDWVSAGPFEVGHGEAMRLLKVTEEAGEAAQAYIGVTGQNPRKGVTHTDADVVAELFDVIISAMVAMYDYSADPERDFKFILDGRASRLANLTNKKV